MREQRIQTRQCWNDGMCERTTAKLPSRPAETVDDLLAIDRARAGDWDSRYRLAVVCHKCRREFF